MHIPFGFKHRRGDPCAKETASLRRKSGRGRPAFLQGTGTWSRDTVQQNVIGISRLCAKKL